VNTYIAHHFNHIPFYGLVIIFLVTAAYTVALIKWITELYRQKSLKYKLIISSFDLNKHLYSDENQERLIRFGVSLTNNSDIPIFHRIELVSYHLANQTNPKISECSDKESDFISPRCSSRRLFPAIRISFSNTNRSGELVFNILYGKESETLTHKVSVKIDIAFAILLNGQVDYSHNIKKFEYI
jgi:hypothetical protein